MSKEGAQRVLDQLVEWNYVWFRHDEDMLAIRDGLADIISNLKWTTERPTAGKWWAAIAPERRHCRLDPVEEIDIDELDQVWINGSLTGSLDIPSCPRWCQMGQARCTSGPIRGADKMSDSGIVWTFAVEPPSYRIEDMRRVVRNLGKALRPKWGQPGRNRRRKARLAARATQ